jgi:hypothetical protein
MVSRTCARFSPSRSRLDHQTGPLSLEVVESQIDWAVPELLCEQPVLRRSISIERPTHIDGPPGILDPLDIGTSGSVHPLTNVRPIARPLRRTISSGYPCTYCRIPSCLGGDQRERYRAVFCGRVSLSQLWGQGRTGAKSARMPTGSADVGHVDQSQQPVRRSWLIVMALCIPRPCCAMLA